MKIYPQISLCMTTGRRIQLFSEVVNTFIKYCLDMDLIYETIIVDDRSEKNELDQMFNILKSKKFPKIKIISSDKPGQLNSIKKLYDKAEMWHVMHLEDDFIFLKRYNFIRKSFDILNTDKRIKQVSFRNWKGIYVKHGIIEYRMHHYSPLSLKEWDIIKENDCTYYGLSFNPCLVEKNIVKQCIKDVNQIDSGSRTWDKQVSKKFWEIGYKRANLTDEYIRHIGKESFYERNN